jgi:sugar phosphate isomerase/epimerase
MSSTSPAGPGNSAGASAATAIPVSDAAWEALQGAYDLQVHVAPDVIERRIDDLDLAKEFLARGLRGFVLKSHYFPTAERAKVVARAVPGIAAYGAITLNHSVGGLNPVAIELAGRSGCKIVWMPTVDAANETAGRLDGPSVKLPFWAKIQRELAATGIAPPPLTVIDANGKVSEPMRRCIELIAKHNMILATGHLGRVEIFALVKAAREMGTQRVLVTHAEFPSQSLTADEQNELANMGAYIEHCFTTMYTGKAPWDEVLAAIRKVGPERCVLSTDLGQTINPPVSEGFAMFAQKMLDGGFSVAQVRRMTVTNPVALVQ